MQSTEKLKTYAKIDLLALERNYLAIKNEIAKASPDCEVMCVVKADAYGHGAEACVTRLAALGVRSFGVSCIEEAREVARYAPKGSNILILGYTPVENADELVKEGYLQTVYSVEYAKELSRAAVQAHGAVRVHIKLDTGMNRIGLCASDTDECACEVRAIKALEGVRTEGIFTHFACADAESEQETKRQHGLFADVLNALGSDADGLCVHCCNSAAAMRFPEFRHNMVRVGIILYGLSPDENMHLPVKLSPVMTFMTKVIHVHTLKKGERVSYGGSYTAERDMRVATLGVGYADGFLRAFSGGGSVLINGREARVVGRVCMDQCMVDIGDSDVKRGDVAVIFDPDGVNIQKLAHSADTIDYELVCLVGKRVRRINENA